MPVGYNGAERRQKNFRFEGGSLLLGKEELEERVYGPRNEQKSKAQDTPAGQFVSKTQDKKSEEGWKLENEDGSTTNVGSPNNQKGEIDFTQPIDVDSMDENQIKALQKKIGANPDGDWGPASQRALNLHYAFEGIEPPNAKRLGSILKDMGAVIKQQPDNKDTIGGKKPSYATNELSSGGDVSPELIESVDKDLRALNVPGLRITAGNDAYHQGDRYSRPGKSAHAKGKALDFTTDDPQAVRDAMLKAGYKKKVTKKYVYYVSPDGSHRVLDEYAKATKNTTGGHFDWKVY